MKTITPSEDPAKIPSVFEQANDEDVIIQLADGGKFMLSAIDDFDSLCSLPPFLGVKVLKSKSI
ncbi:MAG: hypothetical protein F6K47_40980 [Symploca sp. SIO2E6]|nr:hypothetical protein [Symploca sp. SIO2E6]